MLELLHGAHLGQSASIVASGPSATRFDGSTAISIAVNGAAYLERRFDYFLCGDHNSHRFGWFRINCADVRIISKLVASLDYQLYPKQFDDIIDRIAVPAHRQRRVQKLISPVFPHFFFNYRWYRKGRLGINHDGERRGLPDYLMFTGTISCCAVQLAYMMGCSEIHLYGCTFKRNKQHYFYDTEEKLGNVSDSQFKVMETCLEEVRSLGVKVYIHGKSRLTQADKKYE